MKDFKCEICEIIFNSKVNLRSHFKYNHDGNGKVFNCNVCTNSFQAQNKLTIHNKNACGKEFSHAGNLKRHKHKVHEGLKDYKC